MFIFAELERLKARNSVVSSNVQLRRDGLPYSNRRPPEDPGVAVYFELDGRQQCIPCDRWRTCEENARAIWKSIQAIRGLDRWGAKSFVEAAFKGFEALPPAASDWRSVLKVGQHCTWNDVRESYRKLARTAHPDHGGSEHQMADVNLAYEAAKKFFSIS